MKPTAIKVLGKVYSITYCDKPSDVDLYKRESLWGQIDYWTRTIRIYDDGNRAAEDTWQTILHEILHAIGSELNLDILGRANPNQDTHDELDVLALALTDVLFENHLSFDNKDVGE